MRAVDLSLRRVSHPSESDLPEAERTWFFWTPPTAAGAARIYERASAEDGTLQLPLVATAQLCECLHRVENLTGPDGTPIEVPTEPHAENGHRVTVAGLALIPVEVRTWLSQLITAAGRLDVTERRKS